MTAHRFPLCSLARRRSLFRRCFLVLEVWMMIVLLCTIWCPTRRRTTSTTTTTTTTTFVSRYPGVGCPERMFLDPLFSTIAHDPHSATAVRNKRNGNRIIGVVIGCDAKPLLQPPPREWMFLSGNLVQNGGAEEYQGDRFDESGVKALKWTEPNSADGCVSMSFSTSLTPLSYTIPNGLGNRFFRGSRQAGAANCTLDQELVLPASLFARIRLRQLYANFSCFLTTGIGTDNMNENMTVRLNAIVEQFGLLEIIAVASFSSLPTRDDVNGTGIFTPYWTVVRIPQHTMRLRIHMSCEMLSRTSLCSGAADNLSVILLEPVSPTVSQPTWSREVTDPQSSSVRPLTVSSTRIVTRSPTGSVDDGSQTVAESISRTAASVTLTATIGTGSADVSSTWSFSENPSRSRSRTRTAASLSLSTARTASLGSISSTVTAPERSLTVTASSSNTIHTSSASRTGSVPVLPEPSITIPPLRGAAETASAAVSVGAALLGSAMTASVANMQTALGGSRCRSALQARTSSSTTTLERLLLSPWFGDPFWMAVGNVLLMIAAVLTQIAVVWACWSCHFRSRAERLGETLARMRCPHAALVFSLLLVQGAALGSFDLLRDPDGHSPGGAGAAVVSNVFVIGVCLGSIALVVRAVRGRLFAGAGASCARLVELSHPRLEENGRWWARALLLVVPRLVWVPETRARRLGVAFAPSRSCWTCWWPVANGVLLPVAVAMVSTVATREKAVRGSCEVSFLLLSILLLGLAVVALLVRPLRYPLQNLFSAASLLILSLTALSKAELAGSPSTADEDRHSTSFWHAADDGTLATAQMLFLFASTITTLVLDVLLGRWFPPVRLPPRDGHERCGRPLPRPDEGGVGEPAVETEEDLLGELLLELKEPAVLPVVDKKRDVAHAMNVQDESGYTTVVGVLPPRVLEQDGDEDSDLDVTCEDLNVRDAAPRNARRKSIFQFSSLSHDERSRFDVL